MMKKLHLYLLAATICGLLASCETSDEDIPPVISVPEEITVAYGGSTATVNIPATMADSVTATVSGANVTLTSAYVGREVMYRVAGASDNGSLVINGNYKFTLLLDGLQLTNPSGAAIDIECGKRIKVNLVDGTTTRLADSAGGTQKACFYARGHVEFSGGGALLLSGNTGHAFSCKEYLELKKSVGQITVQSAVKDGLHCGEYFRMDGGTVTVGGTGSDCIDSDDLGNMFITAGTLNLTVSADDSKGLKCDSTMAITGGTFNISVPGNGSKGISVKQNLTIGSAQADPAPVISIVATGGVFDPSGDNTKCMGIKVDRNLTIERGAVTVINTGTKSTGIKVDGIYTLDAAATVSAEVDN